MNRRDIATGVAGLALLGTAVAGFTGWYFEHKHVGELESQVAELLLDEKRSAVVRSVSQQMEEIASQQKEISDEQREEALQQKRMADEMRLRSEVERQNALVARREAEVSEQQAQEARHVAENERIQAEHQRIQAEFSKRVADTLSYIALGRSLGSVSLVQEESGNTELAALLAYASYLYTNRYKGDVYYPAVFQSLMSSSRSLQNWPKHRGALMSLAYFPTNDERIVSACSYGSIKLHRKQGDNLASETLFDDTNFDFRCVYTNDDGSIFAVSRWGHLLYFENGNYKEIPLTGLKNPSFITSLDDNTMLIAGDNGLAVYDLQQKMITAMRELDFRITCCSRYNYMPILFDDKGRQHQVKNINELMTSDNPVRGRVTAFASSKSSKMQVYGMSDGTIYLYDENTSKTTKLVGHLSRVSNVKLNGYKLLSSSYDGTVRFWNVASEKVEPTTLVTTNTWIMDFCYDKKKESIWIGDQNGIITEAVISVPVMVDFLKKNLKRDLTNEEWNYYIGKNVPYESFINGKEVEP